MKYYWIAFAAMGFLSVVLGAFGAHGLKNHLDEKYLAIFHTGVTYQFYHTLALGIALVAYQHVPAPALVWAMRLFLAGIVIFSGSLYALALTKVGILGAITPIGGVSFLAGWVCFGWAFWKS